MAELTQKTFVGGPMDGKTLGISGFLPILFPLNYAPYQVEYRPVRIYVNNKPDIIFVYSGMTSGEALRQHVERIGNG